MGVQLIHDGCLMSCFGIFVSPHLHYFAFILGVNGFCDGMFKGLQRHIEKQLQMI